MDSIFKLDPKGYQKCKGEKEPNIVYEGNWLLSKKNERNVEVEEVKLFGLDLDCSNVLNVTERAKTAGSGWFDLSATDITEEMRNELKIIQMRSVLNPKHFYKKSDSKSLPKYFHIGTVQNLAIDHYNEKKARTSKALVNDLLEDQNFQMFNKRKYNEVIQRTDKYAQRKIIKKMKKLKKNK
ncbi:deoxynucleotidyltransferase terminal-interacting protein 2 isoform X2 [Drosophila ficusphila]|uniref:deoxynucleotidyltransferase terminal-interacting protein 2 isoform X2 n=1 Tax=Drosophila ficusphila TaxID=30025 RepID=UPI001C890245|nr:deoxynucleotidyltransferase terminal-interacting protein 2 isoform X2 [Drosophila ficusphila]